MTGVLLAFSLTLLAGLSTAIGGAIGVMGRGDSKKVLSVGLGLSAGVMIYVSLFEIMHKGMVNLQGQLGARPGAWAAIGAFFGGIALIGIIDKFVPAAVNPHEPGTTDDAERRQRLMRAGTMTALALVIHNFPEGFATFMAGLQSLEVALPVAIAIAIHNIPEGLAVAVPIHHATGSRAKGFWYSALSGLAEPIGALIGYLLLSPFLSDALMGMVFCGVAGIMVFISLDELLPTAEAYGYHHLAIYGVIAGMAIMAASLVLFV